MKICSKCDQQKEETEYYTRSQAGKKYLMPHCKACEILRTAYRRSTNEEYMKKYTGYKNKSIKKQALKESSERASRDFRAKYILKDSRKSDKKLGRDNNLTIEFIEDKICHGCNYCGENSIQICLDRKDNNIGHIVDNVIASCSRCNFTRRNMPYDAWVIVAKSMKQARELGLFGDWTGAIWNSK